MSRRREGEEMKQATLIFVLWVTFPYLAFLSFTFGICKGSEHLIKVTWNFTGCHVDVKEGK